jgi:hypothetical protein
MTPAAIARYARRWQPMRSYALLHIWYTRLPAAGIAGDGGWRHSRKALFNQVVVRQKDILRLPALSGELPLTAPADIDAGLRQLQTLPGIGRWTAN